MFLDKAVHKFGETHRAAGFIAVPGRILILYRGTQDTPSLGTSFIGRHGAQHSQQILATHTSGTVAAKKDLRSARLNADAEARKIIVLREVAFFRV